MLALIENDTDTIISQVAEGERFDLPNGDTVDPAYDGWSNDDYRLATILPADAVPEGKQVASTSIEMVDGQPQYVNVLEDIPPPPVPDLISRREFYQGLAVGGKITKEEALAAIKTGTIPAALQVMLDGMTDEDAKFDAECLLAGASDFNRDHPLVMIFAMAQGMTEQDVDEFWRLCAAL